MRKQIKLARERTLHFQPRIVTKFRPVSQFSHDGRAAPEKFSVFSYSAPEITVRLNNFCLPSPGREEKVPMDGFLKPAQLDRSYILPNQHGGKSAPTLIKQLFTLGSTWR